METEVEGSIVTFLCENAMLKPITLTVNLPTEASRWRQVPWGWRATLGYELLCGTGSPVLWKSNQGVFTAE